MFFFLLEGKDKLNNIGKIRVAFQNKIFLIKYLQVKSASRLSHSCDLLLAAQVSSIDYRRFLFENEKSSV